MILAQKYLRTFATQARAKSNEWFFKTGPGQYGFGDLFIGVSVPHVRTVAKKYSELSFKEIKILLDSPFHEDRLLGLIILTNQFEKEKNNLKKTKILKFYLKNKKGINNWDLVDLTAYKILGEYSYRTENMKILKDLLYSDRHWDRRMSIMATFYFIKKGDLELTFKFATELLQDKEDLMHKATGWMLREAGKKDIQKLKHFLSVNGKQMPRTMLRYAIEKFPEKDRKKLLIETRK